MKVVVAHDFAETYGGAERIAARIAALFPDAPFWTILGRREVAERMGVSNRFFTLLPELPGLMRHYRGLAPLYPILANRRRLPEADLLITSSYAFAQGFATKNGAPHLCYSYGPLRFAWSMRNEYAERFSGTRLGPPALRALAFGMRAADRRAARRVTRYVASSKYVAGQLEEHYGRESEVIWPPVDTKLFHPGTGGHDAYFLFCSRLIEPYKRPTLAVEAFRGSRHRLIVAGDGPALPELRRIAGPNVEFAGHLRDSELVPLMQRCAAAIFPSRDDFGLIPVEVMACGRPALAFGAGGALETVVPGRTGEFFYYQNPDVLRSAIDTFDPDAYDVTEIRAHAEGWAADRFDAELLEAVRETTSV